MSLVPLRNRALARVQGLTFERLVKSARFRAMNNLARFGPVRMASAFGLRTPMAATSDIFPDARLDHHVAALNRDGISPGLDLPPALRDEIRAWFERQPCFGNRCKDWGFFVANRKRAEQLAGKPFTVAPYYNILECEAVARLSRDPVINELALRYVGPRARFLHGLAWWSFANEVSDSDRNEFAQQFHFDLDDYRFIKFFFYLTDVDSEGGPHVYVRGSHRAKKLRHLYPMRRLSDAEVEATYGKEQVHEVHGASGSGFIVDTFGIHKGLPPRSRDRLVVELEFGQHNWAEGITEPSKDQLKLLE